MANLPGALTHTSVALKGRYARGRPAFDELRPGNTFARAAFRHHGYLSDIAVGCLFGFGAYGYELAILAADRHVAVTEES
jgi:3-dehydroquinate dehydratase-2